MLHHTALLLDMDGVLAEVEGSFRAAILQTCAAFGTKVEGADVARAKAAGGANNDWVLTETLIRAWLADNGGAPHPDLAAAAAEAGPVTFEGVKARFELLYQGDPERGVPGLCETETLIPEVEVLRELHRRTRGQMAIVTGRPRADCMNFLRTHDLEALFPVCACMEDGPPKPDPFPVTMAIEGLCKIRLTEPEHCIMVGDTPDDVQAAYAAGTTAVGVWLPKDHARYLLGDGAEAEPAIIAAMRKLVPGQGQGKGGGDGEGKGDGGGGGGGGDGGDGDGLDIIRPGLAGLLKYFPRDV